jgi:hypothetical protein
MAQILRTAGIWRGRLPVWVIGFTLAFGMSLSSVWAFDQAGFVSRLEATKAELATKSLSDSKATLARLGEMMTLGAAGVKEYGAKQPKFARLMDAIVADAEAMKGFTDPEIEAKWGEQGVGGDAAGVPLKSLGQYDETRAALELVVGPAHAYILIKKWETARKVRWLDQAKDELTELSEHLKHVN